MHARLLIMHGHLIHMPARLLDSYARSLDNYARSLVKCVFTCSPDGYALRFFLNLRRNGFRWLRAQ